MSQRIQTDKQVLADTISEVAALIKTTMGPYPANVTITRKELPDGRVIPGRSINDGVQIIRALESSDPMVNLAYERMRRACEATLKETGDGTSSTAVLFKAFYDYLDESQGDVNVFVEACEYWCESLRQMALKVDETNEGRKLLQAVANIAMHGHEWAQPIASLLFDLGIDGAFTIEPSKDGKFSTERLEGFRWGAGVASPYFMNNPRAGRLELNDVYVAITSDEVNDLDDIKGVLEAYMRYFIANKASAYPLVIVAPRIVGNPLSALINSHVPGINAKAPIFVIGVPGDEDARQQMADLAAVLGTEVLDKTQRIGAGNLNVEISMFGKAKKVVSTSKFTTFVPEGSETSLQRVEQLQAMLAEGEDSKIRARISNIKGSFGVIRINVDTESSFEHMKEVVEDGYRAVQSAMIHGVLPGGGKALFATGVSGFPTSVTCAVAEALDIEHDINGPFWETADIRTEESVDAIEAGILDNAGSIISAVKNAAAEAALLVNTKYFIVND